MGRFSRQVVGVCLVTLAEMTAGCNDAHEHAADQGAHHEHHDEHDDEPIDELPASLFVAHEGALVSYDIESGVERQGVIGDVRGPTDMQALPDGTLLLNLTDANSILAVDGITMTEVARIPSSQMGAKRPTRAVITPANSGKRYWITLNDGTDDDPDASSALFVDVLGWSKTYLEPVGEVKLGRGHHEASFSATLQRVAITSSSDCENVITIYDYTDTTNIAPLRTLTAADLGFDGTTLQRTCDPTGSIGVAPSSNGCATSRVSGKVYCSISSSGDVVVIGIDETPPSFSILHTGGSGAGHMRAHENGELIYSVQASPREGSVDAPGAPCQVGQLVVIDAVSDAVVNEVPLFYDGDGCAAPIAGTHEETVEPLRMRMPSNESYLYITLATSTADPSARVERELVLDMQDPASPSQLSSLPIGASRGRHADALGGDGASLFVANNLDSTVTYIDAAEATIVRTMSVRENPLTLATYGGTVGPSEPAGPIH